MSDERRGIVPLPYDGRMVPLRFTWAAIDKLGRGGVAERLEVAAVGGPGDMTALSELVEAASAGEIEADALMTGEVPFQEAFEAVLTAWALASRRPAGAERDENPLNRLWTSLKTLWRRLWQRA